jgi:hypothetical protein
MRINARRELRKDDIDIDTPRKKREKNISSTPKKTPSLFSGYTFAFLGVLAFMMFWNAGQYIVAIGVGAPFTFLGIYRTYKATLARTKKQTL